jgi:hypothetical protein
MADASFAGVGQVSHEMADHVSGAILEARILAIEVDGPVEDAPLERGGVVRVARGNAEVGDPGASEHP